MNILATICARKNSQGIKNKNLQLINKKHLIGITIEQAKKSKIFDKIVVSSDCKKINTIGKKYGANKSFKRITSLSNSKVSKVLAIRNLLKQSEKYYNKKFDIIVDLDVTSPLRKISDIKKAIKKFSKSNAPNMISGNKAHKNPYFNMIEIKNKRIKIVKETNKIFFSRQVSPKVYDLNASIYIWKRQVLLKEDRIILNDTIFYEMPRIRSIDIDEKVDLHIVKSLINLK